MNSKVMTGIAIVIIAALAFVGGAYLGPKVIPGAATSAQAGLPSGGPGGQGGPMANLSDEERAKVQDMSDEERRAYLEEKMGSAGTQGGGMRGPGGIEGEVLSASADQFTVKIASGGSQNIYLDETTVIAYATGVEQKELAAGDTVIVSARPETDGVMTATSVIVK